MKTAAGHNASLTGCAEILSTTGGSGPIESLDCSPQRNRLIDTVRKMDEYETGIVQTYADRLLKARGKA